MGLLNRQTPQGINFTGEPTVDKYVVRRISAKDAPPQQGGTFAENATRNLNQGASSGYKVIATHMPTPDDLIIIFEKV